MHARVTRFEDAPDKIDAGIVYIKDQVAPNAKQQRGFKKGYWLVDRATGKGLSITLWESEAAMKASEDNAARVRTGATQATGATMGTVDRYEVAVEA
jgi:heme-degrading monooxygenase HmoA